jgi:hypothetical protein
VIGATSYFRKLGNDKGMKRGQSRSSGPEN